MIICLLGKPGCGKDTLCEKLQNATVLTTGALYRKEYELKTPFGIEAASYWLKGDLCPNDMTNELMRNYIVNYRSDLLVVLNGYPRRLNQAEFLDSIVKVDLAIDLCCPDNVIIERMLKRGRVEETNEVIAKRLEVYSENNQPIVDYYRSSKRYKLINSNQEIHKVYEDFLGKINE